MPTTQQIEWADGSGDKIYISASEFSGNQQVAVSSDPNTGAARSKVVTFSAGNVSKTLTVEQAAGTPTPAYVSNGLVLWLDGIEKGNNNTAWIDKVNGTSFTNHGATFNNDHVYFDGIDDYLSNTTYSPPTSGTGTIEVVIDNEDFGQTTALVFMARTRAGIGFGATAAKYILYSCGATQRPRSIATLAKASFSISNAGKYQNGVELSTSGSDYWGGQVSGTNFIGKRNTGNYFKGKIYSIRIYNRQLSESEILANLAVDNARFNLGLSL